MNHEALVPSSALESRRAVRRIGASQDQQGRRYWMRLGRAAALAAIGIGVQLWIDGALRMNSSGPAGEFQGTIVPAESAPQAVPLREGRLVLATHAGAGSTAVGTGGGALASPAVPERVSPSPVNGVPQASARPADGTGRRAGDAREPVGAEWRPPVASRPLPALTSAGVAAPAPRDVGRDDAAIPADTAIPIAPVQPRLTLARAAAHAPIASGPGLAPLNPPQLAVRMHETESILQVLQRYQRAVERMDARAAQAVWPSLDARALARAFTGLESNSLAFEDCGVTISTGAVAQAQCRAIATYLPKVGRRKPVNASHEYTFTFSKTGGDWRIDSAAIR